MTWSPTPAVRRRLAMPATAVLPSAINAASARAMRFISWPDTDPAHSLSTLSPERYRPGPKTRYEASGAELPRWSFHPLEIMSFSCRTLVSTLLIRLLDKSMLVCYPVEHGHSRLPDLPSRVSTGLPRR